VLAVSQSGRSAEIVRLVKQFGEHRDVPLIAVTNAASSPVAKAATHHLDMSAGTEKGPATKTFTATMVIMQALAQLLIDSDTSPTQVADQTARLADQCADGLRHQLANARTAAAALRHWAGDYGAMALLGRGVGLAAAEVGALVAKEAAHVPALAMDAAEFRHGPMELAGRGLAAAIVSVEPTASALDARLCHDLARRESTVVTIGPRHVAGSGLHLPIRPVSPLLNAAAAAVPLQLLTWALAQERHPKPGHFLIGSKVTTEE
jgi:glutamine---fructose-6-phosphate transaminase (isomerizing)